MTEQFASIELAGLYETQGYIDDALDMYKILTDDSAEAVRKEALEAVARLEKKRTGHTARKAEQVHDIPLKDDASPEKRLSALIEEWLTLMVSEKRVNAFKVIKARGQG